MVAKPIVKWAGGKSRLLGELLSRVPPEIGTYAEPFAGGAALFFAIASSPVHRFERALLSDANEELVATYRAVRDDVDALVAELGKYKHDEKLFYRTREMDTRGMSDVQRGARLLFLNRTCYNGLWRVNAAGRFNVPFGRYKNPKILHEPTLRAASTALARAEIVHDDFSTVTRRCGAGDFVYLDPPYVPLSRTAAFTSYAANGFSQADQERLVVELAALRDRGAHAMLSNHDCAETRELYREFSSHVVYVPRAINSNASKRGDTAELIVQTWGEPGVHAAAARRASSR